ncbi:MAG: hypothetical protein AAGD06_31505, partial [Acidobacteriota bacterium]
PLYTLLSTVYIVLGGEHAPAVQNLFGLLWMALEAGLMLVLLHRLGHRWAGLAAALMILGNYNLTYLYLGMETHVFVALVLLAMVLNLDGERPWALGVALGLAFLVRYDAALVAALIGVDRWIRDRRLPWRMTLAFTAVVLPWLVFAQLYFGSILPTSFGAKKDHFPALNYVLQVFEYYRTTYGRLLGFYLPGARLPNLAAWGFPAAVLFGVAAAAWRDRRALVPAAYPALHLAAYALIGSHPASTWHVYLLNPFGYAFFAVGVAVALGFLGGAAARRIPALGRRRWLPVAVAVALMVPLLVHLQQQMRHRYRMDPLTGQLHAMSAWMVERYPAETSLLQPGIGVLGWETGFRIVDHAGLVTPGLYFHDDLHCTPVPEVLELHAPDLVLLSQWSPAEIDHLGYRRVKTFVEPYEYRLYERKSRQP